MYSKDFLFFLEHQIIVWCTNNGKHVTFCSALEPKKFKTVDGLKSFSNEELIEQCKNIHTKLLNNLELSI